MISDRRQVLHLQPRRYEQWSQTLEVTFGERVPGEQAPLLGRSLPRSGDATRS